MQFPEIRVEDYTKSLFDFIFIKDGFNPNRTAFNYLDTKISYGEFKKKRIKPPHHS